MLPKRALAPVARIRQPWTPSEYKVREQIGMAEEERFDLIEESDRGCVIVGASILEGYLAEDIERVVQTLYKNQF